MCIVDYRGQWTDGEREVRS